jgi:cyclopropane fatty-acyl-phospholipid synthase-like methyltransferase
VTETPSPAPPVSPEPLMQMVNGLQLTAILQAGLQLGVFDQIAAGKDRADTIAAAIDADERGTRILLDALAALELLDRDGDTYRLSPVADAFLISGRPTYLGGAVDIFAPPWAWSSHQRLAEVVRHGGTILDEHAETPGHAFWETFAPSSVSLAAPAGQMIVELVGEWSGQREELKILDVACGSGLVSLPLAAQQPRAHATLLDWANVLELTKDNVGRLGLHERTSLIEGDMFQVPLGGPYDLIIASHVFHHFSEQRCRELMQRLASVLKADGRLVIHDFVAGPQPAQAPFPYLFSVRMLTWTREGQAYSLDTYRRLLQEAGFAEPEVHASQALPSQVLIAGLAVAGR